MGRLFFCLLTVICSLQISAQPAATQTADGPLKVYLATFGPGDAVYERWGHNVLIIKNVQTQQQIAYHYGVFDFDQPNFLGRFILGRMLYSMGGVPPEYVDQMVSDYVAADRDVWMQELDLSQPQINHLLDYLADNYQEQNRSYLYEYYRSNCSTKLRDALDVALDGQLKQHWGDVWTEDSYRRYTRIGAGDNFWVYTGLSFSLSSNVDGPISVWDEAFVPMNMREQLDRLIINGHPFVREEKVLHVSKHLRLSSQPPQWIPIYMVIGTCLGGAMFLCGLRFRRTAWTNRALRVMTFSWSVFCGAAGLFLLFAWFCTDHVSAHANQNLLLFSPLSFVLMILAPGKVKGRERGRWALPMARAVMLLAVGSLVLKIMPVPRQLNWEMIALALPVHFGLLLAITEPCLSTEKKLKSHSADATGAAA